MLVDTELAVTPIGPWTEQQANACLVSRLFQPLVILPKLNNLHTHIATCEVWLRDVTAGAMA